MDRVARNLIGGRFVEGAAGGTFRRENPSRRSEIVGEATESGAVDVDAAVAAARAALPGWRAQPGPARGRVLLAAADALAGGAEDLARLVAREVGKPLGEARGEVARGVALLRYYGAETERAVGASLPHPDGRSLLFTRRVPLGCVGLITPWNFPVAIPLWKGAPALAFGNTVVWKPARWASLVAHRLSELLAPVLPPGVWNTVLGGGGTVGAALAAHPGVDGLSFTGSEALGRRLASDLGGRGVKFQGELGGKNPAIVLADADLERAAEVVCSGAFRFAGQKCTATSRVIVEAPVRDAFVAALVAAASAMAPQDALAPGCVVGPVVAAAPAEGIRAAIARACAEGSRVLCGGADPVAGLEDGHFIAPTVIDRVAPDQALAQEEIFGPVLAVLEAADAAEAVQLANRSRYGLSASLFTRSLDAAIAYVDRIEAGMVRVNAETAGVDYLAPFGGVKASSTHSREQGAAAVEFYTEIQTVTLSPSR
jgi:aldehyde dehydrogenase (NAD+)